MTALIGLLLGLSCRRYLDPEHFCDEVGYAIAARTLECTGDEELAQERFERYRDEVPCARYEGETLGEEGATLVAPEDLYHCPLTLRNLACERVLELGDDLEAWVDLSPICRSIAGEDGL